MARASHEVKVRLTAEDRASGEFKKVEKSARGLGDYLRSNFVVTLGDVTRVVSSSIRIFAGWVQSALDAEQASRELTVALQKTGDATEGNIAALKAQGEAIQDVTKFTADEITSTQAFLKQLGVSTGQLQEATQASINLAASLGISLESAARNVGKTVGGFAGELGELIPELKDLDAEALQAGEGIAFLAEKFEGAAEAAGDTLAGQIQGLNNDLSDLGKGFAQAVTGTDEFKDSIKDAREQLEKTEPFIERSGLLLRALGKVGLEAFLNPIAAIGQFRTELQAAEERSKKAADAIKKLGPSSETAADGIREAAEAVKELAKQESAAIEESNAFLESLDDLGVVLEGNVNAQFDRWNKLMIVADEQLRRGNITRTDYERIERKIIDAMDDADESLRAETASLEANSQTWEQAARSVDNYARSTDVATQSVQRLTQSTESQNAANLLGGQSEFAQIGGGTFTTIEQVGGAKTRAARRIPYSGAQVESYIRRGSIF